MKSKEIVVEKQNEEEIVNKEEQEDWDSYVLEDKDAISPYNGFKLYYPKNWEIEKTINKFNEITIKLSNSNGTYLEIFQGGRSGGCLFRDTIEDFDNYIGAGTKYENYIEINRNDGTVWRLAENEMNMGYSHALCQINELDYPRIGLININIADGKLKDDIVEILEKIIISN